MSKSWENNNELFSRSASNMNETQQESFSEAENWPWTKIVLIVLFCLLIIITVIGNTLVILSVLTTRRLRTVTNLFVMSLAVADWLVGIFVMPPAVFVFSVGKSNHNKLEGMSTWLSKKDFSWAPNFFELQNPKMQVLKSIRL